MFTFRVSSPYRILSLAGVGLAVILALTYFNPYPSPSAEPLAQNTPILEEAMKGVIAQRFDKNGKLIQIVEMDSWFHDKGQAVTQMIAPRLTLHQDNGSQLTVSGKAGEGYQTKMGTQIDKLKLMDDVCIKQVNPKTDNTWELKTTSLLFFPKEPNPTAETDDKVTVHATGLMIEAQGMRADLHRETVELIGKVKTLYATPQA